MLRGGFRPVLQPFEGDGLESNAGRLAEWKARGLLPPDGGAVPDHNPQHHALKPPPATKVRAADAVDGGGTGRVRALVAHSAGHRSPHRVAPANQ